MSCLGDVCIFAGLYYWFPKMTGRMMNDTQGKFQFWMTFVGFNLTFFPMHIMGLLGMPRRIYTYPPGLGWELYNLTATIGAFILGLSVLMFLVNVFVSLRQGQAAQDDPGMRTWNGRPVTSTGPQFWRPASGRQPASSVGPQAP
jgi:heme/copper-type cytochrome/quinol oxidase subunit 1